MISYLSVPGVPVSDEPLVVHGRVGHGDVEGLVEELEVGDAVGDVDLLVGVVPLLVPGRRKRNRKQVERA